MPSQVEQETSMVTQEAEQVCIPQVSKQTRRIPPSPLLWRFVVMVGDSAVLTGALATTLALLAPSYARFNVCDSVECGFIQHVSFGLLHAPIMWIFLVVACWSIAVSITRAQELHCTASAKRGLFRTLPVQCSSCGQYHTSAGTALYRECPEESSLRTRFARSDAYLLYRVVLSVYWGCCYLLYNNLAVASRYSYPPVECLAGDAG